MTLVMEYETMYQYRDIGSEKIYSTVPYTMSAYILLEALMANS